MKHGDGTGRNDNNSSMETANAAAAVQLQQSSLRIIELVRERSNAEEWGAWLQVPLQHAAAVGDKELTTELMLAGASGDPLLAAVKGGQHDLVEHLLVLQGRSPRTSDDQGSQAIHHAARLGHELIVSLLLEHGVEASPLDGSGLTPLFLSAREGHVGVVEVLLDAGADARARGLVDGLLQLPLDLAVEGGHAGVISVFHGRDPAITNDTDGATGYTALHHAAKHNQVGSIDALVDAGADLELQSTTESTALHFAAAFPDCEAAVLALLRHGADKEAMDVDGLTPLLVAVQKGNEASAMALIAAGADCSGGDRHSSLELAVEGRCVALMRVLVENGANVSDSRVGGHTPLHWAAWLDYGPAIDFLIESGANVEAKLDNGEDTPFHFASASAGNLEAIAALVRHGANIHARKVPSGDTPLHIAAMNCGFEGSPGTVDALLKAGADETVVNAAGQTPTDLLETTLDNHGWNGHTDLTQALLTNAPRDRADRRWARRRLFVLCRAFSDRARLASPEGVIGGRSPSFSVNDPTTGNHEEAASNPSDGTIGISRDFSVTMGRLTGLQADLFRTVMEFL